MSKEQTPIEQLTISVPIYNHLKWTISRLRYFNEYYPTDNQRIELIFSIGEMFKNRHEVSKEQYAQAKVLEALEREFLKVDINFLNLDTKHEYIISGKHYYETEVKPRYNK